MVTWVAEAFQAADVVAGLAGGVAEFVVAAAEAAVGGARLLSLGPVPETTAKDCR